MTADRQSEGSETRLRRPLDWAGYLTDLAASGRCGVPGCHQAGAPGRLTVCGYYTVESGVFEWHPIPLPICEEHWRSRRTGRARRRRDAEPASVEEERAMDSSLGQAPQSC